MIGPHRHASESWDPSGFGGGHELRMDPSFRWGDGFGVPS